MYDLNDLLARCQALHDIGALALFGHIRDEFFYDGIINIRLEERHTDLLHHGLDVGFRDTGTTADLRGDILKF